MNGLALLTQNPDYPFLLIDIFPQLVPLNSLLGLECWRPVRAQHNWLGMIPLLKRDRWKFWWLQSLKNNSVQFLKDNYNNWNGYFSKFQDHSQSLCYQSVYVESIMFGIWWSPVTKTWIKTPCWVLTNVLLLRFSEHFRNYSSVWRIFCFQASCECWEFIDQLALRNTTVIIH